MLQQPVSHCPLPLHTTFGQSTVGSGQADGIRHGETFSGEGTETNRRNNFGFTRYLQHCRNQRSTLFVCFSLFLAVGVHCLISDKLTPFPKPRSKAAQCDRCPFHSIASVNIQLTTVAVSSSVGIEPSLLIFYHLTAHHDDELVLRQRPMTRTRRRGNEPTLSTLINN